MGRFGRSSIKSSSGGAKDVGKEMSHMPSASPKETIRDSAKALDQVGHPDFKEGGKFDKLKDFTQRSMSRHMYNRQMQNTMGMGQGPVNDLMMNQMQGSMYDMNAANSVSGGLSSKFGMLKAAMHGKDAISDLMHGDVKGAIDSTKKIAHDFRGNGMNSMVDSVGMLHNANMLGQVQPGTWNQMAQLDNGSMAGRMGFAPGMAAQNPQVAMNAMNAQFAPGAGVPAEYGKPGSSLASKALKVAGVAAIGYGLSKSDTAKEVGKDALEGVAHALQLDDLGKAVGITKDEKGHNGLDKLMSVAGVNSDQTKDKPEGPEL